MTSRWNYTALEEKLRELGFRNVRDARFLGRYTIQGLIVDVMPTDEAILGFSNKWYQLGFDTSVPYKIDELHIVKIFSPPIFIASKLEAFKNRGFGDGRTSDDFEDLVFVLENRSKIWDEMQDAEVDVNKYLHQEFGMLYQNLYLSEWIDAHSSSPASRSQNIILEDLKSFLDKNNF